MTLQRPVKWVEDRVEHFRATTHARESVHDFRIGADADGRIVAMTDAYATDLGGYNSPFGSAQLSSVMFIGPYKVEDGARRAARGRSPTRRRSAPTAATASPRSNFARERAGRPPRAPARPRPARAAAAEHAPPRGPAVDRRRSGAIYDSGDYARCLRMAAEAIGYERARAARPRPGARTGGWSASASPRSSSARATRARSSSPSAARASARTRASRCARTAPAASTSTRGVSAFGQGSETAFAQIVRRRAPASTTTPCACTPATPAPRRSTPAASRRAR